MTAPVIPGSLVSWDLMTPDEADELFLNDYFSNYESAGETIMPPINPVPGRAEASTRRVNIGVDKTRLAAIRRERGNYWANLAAFTAVGRAARLEQQKKERQDRFVAQTREFARRGRGGR